MTCFVQHEPVGLRLTARHVNGVEARTIVLIISVLMSCILPSAQDATRCFIMESPKGCLRTGYVER